MNFLVPICREEEGKRNCICPDESHALCRESSAAFWDSNNNYHHSRYSKQVKCATEDMGEEPIPDSQLVKPQSISSNPSINSTSV
jgi:hypothetical protein